eukprot:TRINITY_DN9709_c0_g1_i1.p1 TRINITY_DN9709_c0_g1~~TRINITY_DN9709_c0_g1_i1.p1  ORF type:complete len:476 (+),score=64.18 TRINITY_DN9709_c0_g1_i1:104-1531(+)
MGMLSLFGLDAPNVKYLLRGDFADILDYRNEWSHAVVNQVKARSGGKQLVVHYSVSSKSPGVDFNTDLPNGGKNIVPFRSRTGQLTRNPALDKGFLVRVIFRTINKGKQSVESFGFPLSITVPGWLTNRELHAYVMTQTEPFLNLPYFHSKHSTIRARIDYGIQRGRTSKSLTRKEEKKPGRVVTILDEVAMTQSKNSPGLVEYFRVCPYKLRALTSGKEFCYICKREVNIFEIQDVKGLYCQGCDIKVDNNPIATWAENYKGLLLSVDWMDERYLSKVRLNPLVDPSVHVAKTAILNSTFSLESCIEKFFEAEAVTLKCEDCERARDFQSQPFLYLYPNILILQLKRFEYRNGVPQKLDTMIKYPLRGLNVGKYFKNPHYKASSIYDLFAVVCHTGSAESGHYYVNIFTDPIEEERQNTGPRSYKVNAAKGVWVQINDDKVKRITESDVITPSAYLLVYHKREIDSKAVVNSTF